MSMNLVILSGRLGADAEIQTSDSGVTWAKISLATSERVKKGEEWIDHTEWHRVVCFGAPTYLQHLLKGCQVELQGSIRHKSFENQNGEKIKFTEITAHKINITSKIEAVGRPPKDEYEPANLPDRPGARQSAPGHIQQPKQEPPF